jgi:hypothetical protein
MLKLFSEPRFLALYSAVQTAAFATTVGFDFVAHTMRLCELFPTGGRAYPRRKIKAYHKGGERNRTESGTLV